ncbi:ROK family transcriptional regulator [Brachybacterium vulturis]|nr:ROK family transcriptional regulator [Brachybacterium vulturis]
MLALLHRGRKLTRGEIAEALRLTRTTVSDILGGLLDQGIITVTEQRSPGGRGRPAEVLGIHPGAVRFVGIDFSHTTATVCLANSAGDVIASTVATYSTGAGWEARVQQTLAAIRDLAVGEVHLEFLAGIGIGLPGPNSASWHGFSVAETSMEPFHLVRARIRELFADAFGCPVLVDHHIRFAALYEATLAGEDDLSIVYLRLSTGIGGAVLGAGTALRGAHQLAGEIGHLIADETATARDCRCGRRGCLETVASEGAVIAAWQQIDGDGDRDGEGDQDGVELAHFAAALDRHDPRALELATELAGAVGRALGIAALMVDPAEIVIAGEVGALLGPVLPALRTALARQCLTGTEVQVRIGDSSPQQGARGAIAALRTADHPSSRHRPARAAILPHPAEGGLRVR